MRELPRVCEPEWMDGPGVPPAELRRGLAYIRMLNSLLGYNRATARQFMRWAGTWRPGEAITVLDVATGSGDVPATLLRRLRRFGANLRFIGLDLHPVTIAEADRRARLARDQGRGFLAVRGNALSLPLADASVDYAMTSLFLHHLSEPEAVAAMREMWRVARRGVLAADLIRNRRALAWIHALTLCASPMLRHDARASVRQAFTLPEALSLARQAGWLNPVVRRHFAHRFTLTAEKI